MALVAQLAEDGYTPSQLEVTSRVFLEKQGDNVRLPSSRACALARDPETTTCNHHAMAAFASQLTRDPSTGSEPILSSGQVARLVCVPEVVLL